MSRENKPITIRGKLFSEWLPNEKFFERADVGGSYRKIRVEPYGVKQKFRFKTFGLTFLWDEGIFNDDENRFQSSQEAMDYVDERLERFERLESFQ